MDGLIVEKERIIGNILKNYKDMSNNEYDLELKSIENQLNYVENKKFMVLDLVLSGEIKRNELKIQFSKFESDIEELKKKRLETLKQINILKQNKNNIESIKKRSKRGNKWRLFRRIY